MDNKLTLKLDQNIIERAKIYASQKNTSLSKLIESYLEMLTTPSKPEDEPISPLVKSLSGIVSLPKNADYDKMYKKHLVKKYGK
ncbi:MAG TPA: DUF6364 family protein [Bacteroidia bacterium]|nr:DUF6364 family protein [Bacteroidia bacterium]